jgi:hypothetical protein
MTPKLYLQMATKIQIKKSKAETPHKLYKHNTTKLAQISCNRNNKIALKRNINNKMECTKGNSRSPANNNISRQRKPSHNEQK